MIKPQLPENEAERVLLLKQLGVLDTEEEEVYDDVTQLASSIADTPICLISLVDAHRQWFKSHHGLSVRETPRDIAFCAHAINGSQPFVVCDSRTDERFYNNPLVTGEPHVIFYAGAPLTLSTGHNLGTLCVIDSRPREMSPAQIEQLQLLARHVVHLFVLRGKLSFLNLVEDAKDTWLANLSHDLKNPAATIVGFSALIDTELDTLSKTRLRSYLKAIARSSDTLMKMLDDIVELSRIESDCLSLDIKRTDLAATIAAVTAELQSQAAQRKATIACRVGAAHFCRADPKRLASVLTNLLTNALRYSYPGTVVQVATEQCDDEIRVHVSNEGEGIAEDKLEAVFERFGVAGNPLREGDRDTGTGLGLALSRQLIEKMNGTISVRSTPGAQTVFTVALPVWQSA